MVLINQFGKGFSPHYPHTYPQAVNNLLVCG